MVCLLDNILLSPLKFTIWLGKKLRDTAYKELTDESGVYEELLQLQMKFELGEISEEDYEKQEAQLMERLDQIREMKEDTS